jgi:hypothetical protein
MSLESPDIDIIQNRLLRLEKQNRRMKQLGILVLLLAGTFLVMGQGYPGRVSEAERFVVKDARGKIYADLGVLETTSDSRTSSQPLLRFLGPDGKNAVTLLPGSLIMRSARGSTVIESNAIYIRDPNGKVVWRAPGN